MSKKEKSGFIIVNVPIYEVGILFAFGVTDSQIISRSKRFGKVITKEDLHYSEEYAGLTIQKGTSYIVRMPAWPEKASHYSTLQHEIFHVADFSLRSAGLAIGDNSHEAWAYLIGFITRELYNKLWDKKYH